MNKDKIPSSEKRVQDILNLIKSRSNLTTEQRQDAVRSRADKYDIIDIVQTAALQGVTYSEEFGVEVAEGLIRSNTISMVSKVLDSIDSNSEIND
jgi:hypothetical protein